MAYDSESDDIRDTINHTTHNNILTPMSLGSSYEYNGGTSSHWNSQA